MSPQQELERWREGLGRSLHQKHKPKVGVGRRILRTMATALAVTGILGALTIVWFYKDLEDRFSRVDVEVAAATGETLNILVLGSDSREGFAPGSEEREMFGASGGRRADTIMLVQVVPSEQRASILQFPRDLWVRIAGRKSSGKINSAYGDGPQAMINTVQGLTGISINHYMEISFDGFRRVVEAVGGIDVCLEEPLRDSTLNFRLPEGRSSLDGNTALSFVRSRHSTADGDFGRIKRQQLFLKAVVQKIGRPSTLGNPARVRELGIAFAENVTVDPGFNLSDMLRLAVDVRRVGVDQIGTFSVPGRVGAAGGQSVVLLNKDDAEKLFAAVRDSRDPADAFKPQLAVVDASGRGLLESVAADLSSRGFVVNRQQTAAPQSTTVLSAPRSLDSGATEIASTIVGAKVARSGAEIVLTIGQDWQGLTALPAPGEAPPVSEPGLCA